MAHSKTRMAFKMPCTPLVACYLRTRFGEVIETSSRINRELWFRLQKAPLTRYSQADRNQLTESVHILATGKLQAHLNRTDMEALSLVLNKDLITQMCEFIHAWTLADRPAWTAMERWMTLNGIEEDDYSKESAYRMWLRYKASRGETFTEAKIVDLHIIKNQRGAHITPKVVADLLHRAKLTVREEISPSDLSSIINELTQGQDENLIKAVSCFLYRLLTDKSYRQIGIRLNLGKRSVIRFDQQLKSMTLKGGQHPRLVMLTDILRVLVST